MQTEKKQHAYEKKTSLHKKKQTNLHTNKKRTSLRKENTGKRKQNVVTEEKINHTCRRKKNNRQTKKTRTLHTVDNVHADETTLTCRRK